MLALVVLHFSIGILFTTDAGNYWLDIFNDYSANINLLVCGLMQYIVTGFKISSIYLLDIWTNQKLVYDYYGRFSEKVISDF